MNANTVPLQDVLPWRPDIPRNILICDSIETDGSFLISTMVAQLFSSSSSSSSSSSLPASASGSIDQQRKNLPTRALWLSGNSSTERQVASTLKKMGCDAGAPYLRKEYSGNSNLTIRSLAVEITNQIMRTNPDQANEDGIIGSDIIDENDDSNRNKQYQSECFDSEAYLKQIYKEIKAWINYNNDDNDNDNDRNIDFGMSWIILDDVTALSSILGETLVYCFVESLVYLLYQQNEKDTSVKSTQCGLIIRCSGDVDQMSYKISGNEENDHSGWAGAGGLAHKMAINNTIHQTLIPWERALEESVDAIVDILPLPSGFSREAHGRLIFSETPNGRGWGRNFHKSNNKSNSMSASQSRISTSSKTNTNWNKLIFNYSIQDNGARAIRLRA
ncbi:MAG: hypothetical protein ACI8RD_012792 [Bacillariaceae sp.]|jgi:hypothetical protein